MEAEIRKFEAEPADTPEQCDTLLRLLLRMHPANDVRWKAIQGAWKRCSSIEKSAQWLKNRAKKLEAEDSKRSKDAAPTAVERKLRPPKTAGSEQNDELKNLIIMALDHQLANGGSGASGEGLMGAMAQAFGDSFDDHAFHTACEFGRLRNIQQLMQSGSIDVNFRSKDGSTPLLIAMENKHLEACKALAAIDGIDLDCKWVGKGCDTPLILATRIGHDDLVQTLLSRRANVDTQNSHGSAALHEAALIGNARISQLLLAADASVDLQNWNGETALKLATEKHQDEIVKQLLEARSSPSTHGGAVARAPSDLESDAEVTTIWNLVKTHVASHKIAAAHASAAEWGSQADGQTELNWQLQQFCFQRSPFVWQHHKGLIVEKCAYGFGVATRIPIRAHEAILAECAAVPWTEKEVRDPGWVCNYLSCREQVAHNISENELVPLSTLLEGLWPRTSADFNAALATFPDAVQKVFANEGKSVEESMAIARSACNSHHDGTHLSVAFFNHSCSPNCEIRGRYHVQLYATRDIAIGEALTISYFRLNNLLQPQSIRSKIFNDTWGSACACARCASSGSEDLDDAVYLEINQLQQQLHCASSADFIPLILQDVKGKLAEAKNAWNSNLISLVLQDAIQRRLESSEWQEFAISCQGDGLLDCLALLLIAFSDQKAIVGESKQLKPLCRTIIQLETMHKKAGGTLSNDIGISLQQVHLLDRTL